MSRLEELIQQYCPDGLEYKSFFDVCDFVRGITYNKQQEARTEVNAHKVLRANNITLNFNTLNFDDVKFVVNDVKVKPTQMLYRGDILMCAGSGSKEHIGKVAYINEDMDYTFGGFMSVVRCKDVLLPRFMFHILTGGLFTQHLEREIKSSTINNINNQVMQSLFIPVPPLPVQEEIVRILDTFTELQAELQAELQKRLQQYNYYRDNLLSFEGRADVEWKKINEVVRSLTTGLNPRQTFKLNVDGATCPYITGKDIFNNSINPSSKTDKISFDVIERINKRAKLEDDMLLFASTGTGTVGRMAYIQKYTNDWSISETLYAIKTKSFLNTRFLMYCLTTEMAISQYRGKISKGSVPHLKIADLMNVVIPIPSVEEQHRVVELISHFDMLVNDITSGLPAEIEARRKQYEYYRDQLLTFKKKA